MPWSSRLNAEIYDQFVREHQVYRWLNRHLVEDAEVAGASSLLDLGCGTGATTLACLPRMAPQAEIVGVDASAGMVAVARANVHDPRARFVVAPAARVGSLPPPDDGPFDRVVSNAAFLQFQHRRRVLAGLAGCTIAGALLVFNVTAERLVGESAPVHPFQVALQSEVRAIRPVEPVQDEVVDAEEIRSLAAEHGWELIDTVRRSYRTDQRELVELMSIPAMIARVGLSLDEVERDAVIARVRSRIDLDARVEVPWVTFRLRRTNEVVS